MMFRRFRRPAARQALLNAELESVLIRANQLQANGNPQAAAPLFAQLAQAMQTSNHPRRAANLHARAAHAYADARDETHALAHARQALQLFIQWNMTARTPLFYTNITQKLKMLGMVSALDALQKEFSSQVGNLPQPVPAATPPKHLPPSCPKCGAPLRSDEVEWIDAVSAECTYCGQVVQTV